MTSKKQAREQALQTADKGRKGHEQKLKHKVKLKRKLEKQTGIPSSSKKLKTKSDVRSKQSSCQELKRKP